MRFDVPLEGTARVSSGHAMLGIRCEHVHADASGPIVGPGGDRGIPRQRAQRPRRGAVRAARHARRRRGAVRARRRGSARPGSVADLDLRRRDGGAAVSVGISTNETARARRLRRRGAGAVPEPPRRLASGSARPRRCGRSISRRAATSSWSCSGRPAPGKTTLLRTIAGLEQPDAGTIDDGRPGRHRAGPGLARRRAGVPELLALPALVGAAEPRVPAARARPQPRRSRDPAPHRLGGRSAPHHALSGPRGLAALGRRDAARGDRPRDRAPARGCS